MSYRFEARRNHSAYLRRPSHLRAFGQTQTLPSEVGSWGDFGRAQQAAGIDRCPPGGTERIMRLARITARATLPLNPDHGIEGPRGVAVVDKLMHTVIEPYCTGCELRVPACPADCISLDMVGGRQADGRLGPPYRTTKPSPASRSTGTGRRGRSSTGADGVPCATAGPAGRTGRPDERRYR